ncbi:MAG: hypothetical protein C4295_10345 [Candidatus Fervidibacterota bacterium]
MVPFDCCREVEKWVRLWFSGASEREDAEDALQEVCRHCCQYQQRFKRLPPKSWLQKVSDNVCKGMLKGRKEAPIPFSQLADEEGGVDPEKLLEGKEWERWTSRQEVWEVLEVLPPTYRKVLIWRFMEGLSHKEIARRLGCKTESVKVLINKAKKALKKRWQSG